MNSNYAHPKKYQSPFESHCQNALLCAYATKIVTCTSIFSAIKAKTSDFGVLRSLSKWLASRAKIPYGQREQVRPGSACAVRPVFPYRVSMNVDDRHEN